MVWGTDLHVVVSPYPLVDNLLYRYRLRILVWVISRQKKKKFNWILTGTVISQGDGKLASCIPAEKFLSSYTSESGGNVILLL